jgi:Leucine-rich repeat (LRR) protein
MANAAIEKAYGFAFPPDLERFWAIAKAHEDALHDANVRLVGPFAILTKAEPAKDLDRWAADPPELFTVAEGDTDGLHWGYVLHEPGAAPGYVAQFYSRDGYPIEPYGRTLAHAMHRHVSAVASDMHDELAEIRAVGEDHRELARSIARLEALEKALAKELGSKEKKTALHGPKEPVPTLDGLGVRAPKSALSSPRLDPKKLQAALRQPKSLASWLERGHLLIAQKKAGTALQIARDALAILPTKDQDAAVLLAISAYEALGRPQLARTFAPRLAEIQKRTKTKGPPKVDNRISHDMATALLDPTKVERLILERWGSQAKTPDLDAIASLSNLQMLVLRGYPLGDLPASFAKLKKLEDIELFECKLRTLPKVLAKLPRLKELAIIQDSGGRVPRTALTIPKGLAFRELTSLSLVACGLDEVPAFVFGSKNLYKLSLNGNRLRELPDAINALVRLRYLNLAENSLTTLPAAMSALKRLGSMWLGKNDIAALPDVVKVLPLSSLDVGKNPLTKNKAERARTKTLLKKGASIYWV